MAEAKPRIVNSLNNATGEITKFIKETPLFMDLIKRFEEQKELIEKNTVDEENYDMVGEDANTKLLKDKFNAMSDLYIINNKLKDLIETKVKYLLHINGKGPEEEDKIIKKYKDAIENKMNGIYGKNETYPKGLIPEKSEIKFDYGKGDGDGVIIIVPGSVQMVQSQERINRLIEKLEEFAGAGKLDSIKYIVFSGRGNMVHKLREGESVDIANVLKDTAKAERYIKNVNDAEMLSTLPLMTEKIIEDGNKLLEIVPNIRFQTEARMMIKMFINSINDNPTLKPHINSLMPKVYGEHLAMETAANFVLAPLAISYGHRQTGKGRTTIDLETVLSDFQKADLYFVSSDYHIYRCVSLIIQLFAHTKTQGNIYALNAKVIPGTKGSERVLRFAELGSMYQPYEQLTLDVCGNMDIRFRNDANQLVQPKAKYDNIIDNAYNNIFRLLTIHGFYNRYNNVLVLDWQKVFRKNYREVLEKFGLFKPDGVVLSGGSRKLVHKNDNKVHKTRRSKHPKTKRKHMPKKIKRTKLNKYRKPSSRKSK